MGGAAAQSIRDGFLFRGTIPDEVVPILNKWYQFCKVDELRKVFTPK